MFLTLLLALVTPYGTPYTAHNPKAHYQRKAEFFRWMKTVKKEQYQQVPLLFSDRNQEHRASLRKV